MYTSSSISIIRCNLAPSRGLKLAEIAEGGLLLGDAISPPSRGLKRLVFVAKMVF